MIKKTAFYAIMLLVVISVPIALVTGFFVYRKLTFSYDYCEPYGQIDSVIGWTLKPSVASCLSLKNHITGNVFFDTKIYTNTAGFRDQDPSALAPKDAVVLIGDSFTFGYGVDYQQSFPYFLSEDLKIPTINMGVPGYGSGSTYELFSKHQKTLRPKAVVYFTLGLWTRSICSLQQVDDTLVPCFIIDEQGSPQLRTPRPSAVSVAASKYQYPGGYLTSGYKFRDMLFILKPMELWHGLQSHIGLLLGKIGFARVEDRAGELLRQDQVKKILAYELNLYKNSFVDEDTVFLLFDPRNYYAQSLDEIKKALGARFIYLGSEAWDAEVFSQFKDLPEKDVKVPGDGHWAEGANRLIAKSMAKRLVEAGVQEHRR